MTKQEIQDQLKEIDQKLKALKTQKEELLNKVDLSEYDLAEKLKHVFKYGRHDYSVICSTPGGLIESYLSNMDKYMTIDVEDMVDSILENNICDNYEDQYIIDEILGYTPLTPEQYESNAEYPWVKKVPISKIYEMFDDIVKAGCKSFEYDW